MKDYKSIIENREVDVEYYYDHDLFDSHRFIVLDTMKIYDDLRDIETIYRQSRAWSDERNENELPTIVITKELGDDVQSILEKEFHKNPDYDYHYVSVYKDTEGLKIEFKSMPYLEFMYEKYKDSIFPTKISALEHMFAVLGNGVEKYDFEMKKDKRPYNKKYYIDADDFIEDIGIIPIIRIYPFHDKYYGESSIRFEHNAYWEIENIEKYAKLFADCLEATNEESLRKFYMENDEVRNRVFRWTRQENLEEEIERNISENMVNIIKWKEHLQEFKDCYGI